MPYDQKKKRLMNYDGTPVTRAQEMSVRRYQHRLQRCKTTHELAYLRVAQLLQMRYRLKFRTQEIFFVSLGVNFIVDFYFPKFRLGVEIDGRGHGTAKVREKDEWRTKLLLELAGVRLLRFWNEEVTAEPMAAAERTLAALCSQENATPSYRRILIHEARTKPLTDPALLRYAMEKPFFKFCPSLGTYGDLINRPNLLAQGVCSEETRWLNPVPGMEPTPLLPRDA